MKRHLVLILLLLASPALVFAEAVPLSDLLTAADDYWRTSTPQRPVLIQGGNINGGQQYIPVPTSATMGLLGYASGAAALGGLAFYQQTGKDPAMALVDGVAMITQPAWIAFKSTFVSPESYPAAAAQYVGVPAGISSTASDFVDFVKDSASGAYAALKQVISDNTLQAPLFSEQLPTPGTVIQTETGQKLIYGGAPPATRNMSYRVDTFDAYMIGLGYKKVSGFNGAYWNSTQPNKLYAMSSEYTQTYNGNIYNWVYNYPVTLATSGDPWIPETGTNYPGVAETISNSPDPAVKNEAAQVLQNMPATQVFISQVLPESASSQDLENPSISPQGVQQFFSQNAADVANQATGTANDPNATPQEIAAAQVAANAAQQTAEQAQQEMQPEPETYSDIPLSGFESPYNPGPFDIPDRFDTFLANVATTGLFSLPFQYFNSLPGGGSPTYTIEAGTYGTHTVDLSETMGTGLAVLKTVLLLCFAFLSVRVVVLKR